MDENVLAPAVPDDEPEPFIGVVPLHRTDLLDGGLIGGLIRPFGSWAPRLLLQRGARVDAQDLGYLQTLLTRRCPDFERGTRQHGAVAGALDDTDVEKCITTAWQLDKAEALFRVVPLHRGRNGRAGRSRFEAGAALTRRIPEISRRRVVVIIKASPLRSPEISIFAHAPLGCIRKSRYCRARVIRGQVIETRPLRAISGTVTGCALASRSDHDTRHGLLPVRGCARFRM